MHHTGYFASITCPDATWFTYAIWDNSGSVSQTLQVRRKSSLAREGVQPLLLKHISGGQTWPLLADGIFGAADKKMWNGVDYDLNFLYVWLTIVRNSGWFSIRLFSMWLPFLPADSVGWTFAVSNRSSVTWILMTPRHPETKTLWCFRVFGLFKCRAAMHHCSSGWNLFVAVGCRWRRKASL